MWKKIETGEEAREEGDNNQGDDDEDEVAGLILCLLEMDW